MAFTTENLEENFNNAQANYDVSANATKSRLIAAAPDLLAACKLALERIDPDSAREKNGKRPKDAAVLEDWAQEACDALRAAIAKAQG